MYKMGINMYYEAGASNTPVSPQARVTLGRKIISAYYDWVRNWTKVWRSLVSLI